MKPILSWIIAGIALVCLLTLPLKGNDCAPHFCSDYWWWSELQHQPTFFLCPLLWLVGLGMAQLGWRSDRRWLMLLGGLLGALGALLAIASVEPPSLTWSGQDAQGNDTGGGDPGHRSIGIWLFGLLGSLAAVLAAFARRRP